MALSSWMTRNRTREVYVPHHLRPKKIVKDKTIKQRRSAKGYALSY